MGHESQSQIIATQTAAAESMMKTKTQNQEAIMQQRTSDIEGVMGQRQDGEESRHGNNNSDISNLGPAHRVNTRHNARTEHHHHNMEPDRRHEGPEIQVNNFGDDRKHNKFDMF